MSTALKIVQHYSAAPAAVMQLFADRDFLDGRLAAAGGLEPAVAELTGDPQEGLRIVTEQSIPADVLPSMVASMMAGNPRTVRTETWRVDGEGWAADFDVVIKGAPASLKGTMRLIPDGAGSALAVEGSASVPIPLFGGKIEDVIVEQVSALLKAEESFTQQRLGQ